jgi:2-C-methyl-D-erythritol 2,4-cyclodiphosphate synthase
MRIGNGFDVHAFEAGDHVTLGGVRIPFDKGFRAHSDGDVLLHAITDALLGAAGLGDIGRHFPDTDAAYADIDSRVLLRDVVAQLSKKGLSCISVDATVIAEQPKLGIHVNDMVQRIAADLGMPLDRVNVKATTSETLGFCGREEGIAAMASVLLDEADEKRSTLEKDIA